MDATNINNLREVRDRAKAAVVRWENEAAELEGKVATEGYLVEMYRKQLRELPADLFPSGSPVRAEVVRRLREAEAELAAAVDCLGDARAGETYWGEELDAAEADLQAACARYAGHEAPAAS